MRFVENINSGWTFSKDNSNFENVNLPHTWNNLDGQDGGADYLRQKCYYKKTLNLKKDDKKVFIEFEGVNHVAYVTFNSVLLGEHKGGFSTFRFDLTNHVKDGENLLEVCVDNSEDLQVYPQQADFTFFGGIYRDVNLVVTNKVHFDLEYFGTKGVYVTKAQPNDDGSADVLVKVCTKGATGAETVKIAVKDNAGQVVANGECKASEDVNIKVNFNDAVLWDGFKNPYLYSLVATVECDAKILDDVNIKFGVRSFSVDSDKGFILNGKKYPLRGVSRHQDRLNKGWAISREDQVQDAKIIKDMGANTIRLAHYQHSQFFFDLCDEYGFVTWAEIPFITIFLPSEDAVENTKSQMRELVLQNINHASICFWGISNEITIGGETPELIDNQKQLVEITNKLDPTRLTALANVSFTAMESPENELTDVVGYNHYFGWYGGELTDNEEWLDEFHEKYPNRPLGVTEYGAEGITTLHNDNPEIRDYSEEYHAIYHEHMLKIISEREYLWGTYQWNMFDFAADSRDEGGVQGRNNKGLVTYGREFCKDAYYLYKAYWNENDLFVHVTGRRYFDRPTQTTNIKVYSNEKQVTLFVNGEEFAKIDSDKIFIFENVPLNMGENTICAVTATAKDEIKLNRVATPNESYALPPDDEETTEGAKNWFLDLQKEVSATELTFNEGYLSVKDSLNDILANEEAKELLMNLMGSSAGVKMNEGMLKMVGNMQLEIIIKMAGKKIPPDAKLFINAKLQKIKK